jgi:CheY-like chemotaxis protein
MLLGRPNPGQPNLEKEFRQSLASGCLAVFTAGKEAIEEMNHQMANNAEPEKDPGILIYIVDDEPIILELARVILEPLGYRIQTFLNAESAWRTYALAPVHPTLIITDYAMHKMTGLGLIEACRRLRPRQKVLLVSGTVDERVVQDAPSKPDRFLAKPFLAEELLKAVKSAMG